jgi:uncharacterized membrane protein
MNTSHFNFIISLLIIGCIVDLIVHFGKQRKNSGKWEMDYGNLATFIIISMLVMSYITSLCREFIVSSMLIVIWLILPCYAVLRNLKKINK